MIKFLTSFTTKQICKTAGPMKQKWMFVERKDVTTEEMKTVSGSRCTHCVIHKPHPVVILDNKSNCKNSHALAYHVIGSWPP
jgi:hypothetical protein